MTSNIILRSTVGLVALVLAAGAFAACGGDDDADTGKDPGNATGSASSGTSTAPVIDQDKLTFKPEKLTVKLDQKVTFTNSESAIHTVTINGKNQSGSMKKGDQFAWTPPGAGVYKVTCDFHPQMSATVTVE
jgi:plastocyanin